MRIIFAFLFVFTSIVLFAQNVGISDNAFTPQSLLHLQDATGGNMLQISSSTAANTGFQINLSGSDFSLINREAGYLSFYTSNTERMRILGGGNVGIGTTAPTERLVVNGNVYSSSGDFYTSGSNGVINCGGGIMNPNVNVISDGIVNLDLADGDEDLYINDDLEVDDDVRIEGGIDDGAGYGTNGYVLTTNGTDNITWTDPSTLGSDLDDWKLLGNAGTINGTNFLGTTDNVELDFRTNNTVFVRLTTKGQLETMNTGHSVFLGEMAGESDDLTDNYNTNIGYSSGFLGTTNTQNVAVGNNTMYYGATSNDYNVALGYYAMAGTAAYTGSDYNVAIGYNSLYSISGGDYNVAIGRSSLTNITTGASNIAIGNYSANSTTTNSFNIAIGEYAFQYGTISNVNNVALGREALRGTSAYTNTTDNVAIGAYALTYINGGDQNIAIGTRSLTHNTSGYSNIAIGYYSQDATTTGYRNISFGNNSLRYNNNGYYNIAMGDQAMYYATDNNNNNIAIGYKAMYGKLAYSAIENNIAIGRASISQITIGESNIGLGSFSLNSLESGNANIAIGDSSIFSSQTCSANIGIGHSALKNVTTGDSNVGVGIGSMIDLISGQNNVSVGVLSLMDITTGEGNVGIGYNAGVSSGLDADFCVFLGYYSQSSGNYDYSTAIGQYSQISANRQVRIGNGMISNATSIGGPVSWTTVSDGRFKRNEKENVPGIEFIMKLRPVTYNFDQEALNDFFNVPDSVRNREVSAQDFMIVKTGFLAQEVEQAASELGFSFDGVDEPKNNRDIYGLRYASFVVPLVKATQEQQLIIEQQQKTIEMLQQQNAEILKRLEKLEAD